MVEVGSFKPGMKLEKATGPARVTSTQSGGVKLGVGMGLSIVAPLTVGSKQCLFQRVVLMERPLADWLVELTAEPRLPTAGAVIPGSPLTLIRIKFGIGVGLFRIGTTLAGEVGLKTVVPATFKTLEPFLISCLKSPMTISKALRASRSASVSWKLVWASCRSVVARER